MQSAIWAKIWFLWVKKWVVGIHEILWCDSTPWSLHRQKSLVWLGLSHWSILISWKWILLKSEVNEEINDKWRKWTQNFSDMKLIPLKAHQLEISIRKYFTMFYQFHCVHSLAKHSLNRWIAVTVNDFRQPIIHTLGKRHMVHWWKWWWKIYKINRDLKRWWLK